MATQTGVIMRVKADRGYGFIALEDGSPDVFFHLSGLMPGLEFTEKLRGQRVEFTVVASSKGPTATFIRPVS